MHQPRYALFYDNHTSPLCPDVGKCFDVEAFTDRIVGLGVDFLTFHARCNQGLAYYDTKLGIRHPSLEFDLFGELARSCARKEIALSAYFNGGISHEEGIAHREWTRLNFDGREYREPRLTPFVRTMCYNTGYRDHLIAMILEVADNYPVAGFFIDCLGAYPCICPICIRQMKEQGIDWTEQEAVAGFARQSARRLARDIAAAVYARKPESLLFFNGVNFDEQREFASYLECECLPTDGWGYDYLPIHAHYMRTLTEKPIMNMTGRFYGWGDFGGIRPEAAVRFELLYGLAHGMRPNLADHFHPRGDFQQPVFERAKRVFRFLQSLEPWTEGARSVTEIGVVYQGKAESIQLNRSLRAAMRMLGELKAQFDILTIASEWKPYQLLVLLDDIVVDPPLEAHLRKHLAAGGRIIASGSSGLNLEGSAFALEEAWGVEYREACDWDPAYFVMGHPLPQMPLSLYSTGIFMTAREGTSVAAKLVKPYSSRHWDGEHALYYNPPDAVTDHPALTIHQQVAHFSHRIFSGYHARASVELRTAFAHVLEQMLPDPLIRAEGLPSFSRAFLTRQAESDVLHLFAYVPELRGEKAQMIEEGVCVAGGRVSLRLDGRSIRRVYQAPDREPLDFAIVDERAEVALPPFSGDTAIVFEFIKSS